jgi:hypothetical protein
LTSQTRHGSGQDWDDARKSALFADIVSLKLSIEEAAALHGLRVDVIQEWLRLFRRSALLAFDERLKKTLINQGANADALTAAEFTGHIEDVSIADLVQTIEIAGKDAVITVTHDGADSRIWCSAGAIIDAESGRLTGESAVYRILGFERGRMVADLRPEPRLRTIYAATHRLLIEAVRRKDEASRLEHRLGRARFYRLGERSTSARVHVSTDELAILRLFDGPRRIGEVVAQSQLGDLESLTALDRLVSDGYLAETDGAPASSRRAPRDGTSEDPLAAEPAPDAPRTRGEPTERVSRVELHDSSEAPSAPTSFVPMSVSQRPERAAPRWVFAALAAAVLAPAAFWFGETMSNLRVARRTPLGAETTPSAAAGQRAAAGERTPSEANASAAAFPVATTIEPAHASIWLDRHPVGEGRLEISLPRDGTTHELRVAAEGFVPITLLFADVPPPRLIHLEALPVQEPELGAPSLALASSAAPAMPPLAATPAAASQAASQTPATPPSPKDSAKPMPARKPRPPQKPSALQLVESDGPRVRVIE